MTKAESLCQELLSILVCPVCRQKVELRDEALVCARCGRKYPVREGIPDMMVEENEDPESV